MVGDESDNLEGVPGAGWKTVAKRFPILAETNRDIMIADLLESSKLNFNDKKPALKWLFVDTKQLYLPL